MLPLKKPENKRTSTEKSIRNCVFMIVIAYVSLLTWLFLNAQINIANAESDLVSTHLSANLNSSNNSSTDTISEESDLENDELVDVDLVETWVEL